MMSEMFPSDLPGVLLAVTGVRQCLRGREVSAATAVLVIQTLRQETAPSIRLHELRLEAGHAVGHGGGGDGGDSTTVGHQHPPCLCLSSAELDEELEGPGSPETEDTIHHQGRQSYHWSTPMPPPAPIGPQHGGLSDVGRGM